MAATDPIAEHAALVVDHLNEDHADSLLLVGRMIGGREDATAAAAVGIDRLGLDLELDGETVRILFANEVADLGQVRAESVALVQLARERAGGSDLTALERQTEAMARMATFITRVVRTKQLTPAMLEITFGGGDLESFEPRGPDQFVYLLAPPVGRDTLTVDADFTWEGFEEMPLEERPVGANYTVRRWRPDVQELDIWFVLHGGDEGHEREGDGGHAAAWAARARPGDPAGLWGPRIAYEPPDGTDWYLLVADETGLPAVAAILESLPSDATGHAFVEVVDASGHQELRDLAGFEVTWLHRDGAPAGTTTALLDAVRTMPWPNRTHYAWGGAESRTVTAIRNHLRNERGLERDAVSMVGYWRCETREHP